MIIKLQVQHQRIQGVKLITRRVVEGSRRFVYLDLDFDKEWDGLTTTVIFSNDHAGGNKVELPWLGEPLEVPEEMLVEGVLRLACVGIGNNGLQVTTKYMPDGIRVYRAGEQTGYESGSTT